MKKPKIYRDKEGHKLYPVCSWEENQHKIYNADDRAYNWLIETGSEEAEREFGRTQHLLEVFEQYVIGGIVYATYEDGVQIKETIAAYDIRHDEMQCRQRWLEME